MNLKECICSLIFCHALLISAAVAAEPMPMIEGDAHKPARKEVIPEPMKADTITTVNMAAPVHLDMPTSTPPELRPTTLDLKKFQARGFIETRRHLIQRIDENEAGLSLSAENADALLDLSEFFLSYALLLESRSILSALDPAGLSQEQNARKLALSISVNVLDHSGQTLSEREIEILEEQKVWPNHALFRSLYYIRKENLQKAKPLLKQAAKELAALTGPIEALTLPQLLEAAIGTRNWGAAKEFALLFTKNHRLKDSNAYQYLLGRTAETGEDYLVAFDNYVRASKGGDQWAHRARLALVELGAKTNTLTPEEIRELLAQSRFAWRGDSLYTTTLNRLIEAELTLGDVAAALEILGEIIYMNQDEASTLAAKEQATFLLKGFYEKGASGKIGVSDFIMGHQRIADDYRFQIGFGEFSELFADRLLKIGASNEAAREYDTTYNYLSVAQDLGLFEVEVERLDKLRLKYAKALLRGGQYEEAFSALAIGPQSSKLELADEFTFLKAELYNLTGNLSAILKEKALKPSNDYLRIKAKAYFSLEDWENALETYNLFWEQGTDLFSFTDALNMLLAAYREKDAELALKLVDVFPDLTDSPQWQEIAKSLFDENEMGSVLRKDAITDDLSTAARVLDVMEIINTSSQ